MVARTANQGNLSRHDQSRRGIRVGTFSGKRRLETVQSVGLAVFVHQHVHSHLARRLLADAEAGD